MLCLFVIFRTLIFNFFTSLRFQFRSLRTFCCSRSLIIVSSSNRTWSDCSNLPLSKVALAHFMAISSLNPFTIAKSLHCHFLRIASSHPCKTNVWFAQFRFFICSLKDSAPMRVVSEMQGNVKANLEGRISKRVFQGNKARIVFRKTNISYPLIRTRTCCVSGGKKCSFFRKFEMLCFVETSVSRFALLPLASKYVVPSYIHSVVRTLSYIQEFFPSFA